MKKLFVALIFIISLATMNLSYSAQAAPQKPAQEMKPSPASNVCLNEKVIRLKYDMQKLWIEHAWWTRSFIVSSLAELEDQNNVQERLLRNQVDLGNMIKPYYGDEAGNQLTELLKEHILIAGEIINAAKKGEQNNVEKFNKEWQQNADEIIDFLSSANPNWPKKQLKDMFYTYLKLTSDEVAARQKKDWIGDIQTADMNEEHLIKMRDMLTDGIVKQFPDKFK